MTAESISQNPLSMGGLRLEFLDALRGIAAIMVFLIHLRAKFFIFQTPLPDWFDKWVSIGHTGVLLFFILSAFSLCLTMPRHEKTGIPLASFFTHRLFRILPMFYAVYVISTFRNYFLFHQTSFDGLEVVLSILCVNNFYLPVPLGRPVWAGWTISVEMIFYGLFPFIHKYIITVRRSVFAVIAAILLFAAIRWLFEATGIQTKYPDYLFWSIYYIPIFMMGFLAFYITKNPWFMQRKNELTGVLFLGLALAIMYAFSRKILVQEPFFITNYYPLSIGYVFLILGLYCWPIKILVNRFTIFIGKLSFSIYLLHPIIIYSLKLRIYTFFKFVNSDILTFLLTFAVLFACTTIVSWITFYFIESPGIRAGKRIVAKLVANRMALPSTSAPKGSYS